MTNEDRTDTPLLFKGENLSAGELRAEIAEEARRRIDQCEESVTAARAKGDRHEEATQLAELGSACLDVGRPNRAIESYEQALSIFQELDDQREAAEVHSRLGTAYLALNDLKNAHAHYVQALVRFDKVGDRAGVARACHNLGMFYLIVEKSDRAIEHYRMALLVHREISDRSGEATTLGNLATVYSELGQVERAIRLDEQALAVSREVGNRMGLGRILSNLGASYDRLGKSRGALNYYKQALAICRETGDRIMEAQILRNMGLAYLHLKHLEKAVEATRSAVRILDETGGPGADTAREQLDHLRSQKARRTASAGTASIGLILRRIVSSLFPALDQRNYVGIEELYRNAPTGLTRQEDWEQWKDEYGGKYVKGSGNLTAVSAHRQVDKVFCVVTLSEEGSTDSSPAQVALLVEDVDTVALREDEGSFLVDGIKWIHLGKDYAFEGRVSGFSLFDTELIDAGYRDLVVVRTEITDIRKT